MALNLIESLRNTEAMGVWVTSSHVLVPQLTPLEKSFSRKTFRVSYKEGLLRPTRASIIIAGLFLSARTPHHGVDAGCGGEP